MKTRSLFRYCLFFFILPFLSCSNSKEEDATPKKTSHEVSMHVVGRNLSPELGAILSILVEKRQPGARNIVTTIENKRYTKGGNIDTIYTLGTLDTTNIAWAHFSFMACGGDNKYPPPAGSTLTTSIVVDGKTTMTSTLDQTMKGPYIINTYFLSSRLIQYMNAL